MARRPVIDTISIRKKIGWIVMSFAVSRRCANGVFHHKEFLKFFYRALLLRCVFRLSEFHKRTFYHYAGSIRAVRDFVNFQADLGVSSHPFDLLSKSREDINMARRFIGETYGHHVRLILRGASDPPHDSRFRSSSHSDRGIEMTRICFPSLHCVLSVRQKLHFHCVPAHQGL